MRRAGKAVEPVKVKRVRDEAAVKKAKRSGRGGCQKKQKRWKTRKGREFFIVFSISINAAGNGVGARST